MAAFAIAILALGTINSMLLAVLVWRRVRIAQKARRRARLELQLKPAALGFLEGETDLPGHLKPGEQEVLADVLGRYARLLKGPTTARIAAYFESHGTVDRELRALASDRQDWRRAGAAYRLGDIGSPLAADGLTSALRDPSRDVRTTAARSLGKLRVPEAVPPLLEAVAARRIPPALAGWALLQIGPSALPRLRTALDAQEPVNRAGAVRMLGFLGDAADAQSIEERLLDTSGQVRAAAARSMARIGSSRNVPALLVALDDRLPVVRVAAAEALGRLRVQSVDRLLEHARDDRFDVSRAAARAAASINLAQAEAAATATASPHLEEAVAMGHLR
jgi:HEAT repeat protein